MWYYLIGIPLIPYIGYRYLIHEHNKKMIETLKKLTKHPKAIEQEIIQKVMREAIEHIIL